MLWIRCAIAQSMITAMTSKLRHRYQRILIDKFNNLCILETAIIFAEFYVWIRSLLKRYRPKNRTWVFFYGNTLFKSRVMLAVVVHFVAISERVAILFDFGWREVDLHELKLRLILSNIVKHKTASRRFSETFPACTTFTMLVLVG